MGQFPTEDKLIQNNLMSEVISSCLEARPRTATFKLLISVLTQCVKETLHCENFDTNRPSTSILHTQAGCVTMKYHGNLSVRPERLYHAGKHVTLLVYPQLHINVTVHSLSLALSTLPKFGKTCLKGGLYLYPTISAYQHHVWLCSSVKVLHLTMISRKNYFHLDWQGYFSAADEAKLTFHARSEPPALRVVMPVSRMSATHTLKAAVHSVYVYDVTAERFRAVTLLADGGHFEAFFTAFDGPGSQSPVLPCVVDSAGGSCSMSASSHRVSIISRQKDLRMSGQTCLNHRTQMQM